MTTILPIKCPSCGAQLQPALTGKPVGIMCLCGKSFIQRAIAPQHGDGQAVNTFEANPLYLVEEPDDQV